LNAACRIAGALALALTWTVSLAAADWSTGGHDASQTYHSPLARIDTGNVARLGFAWSYDLGTTHGLEATPVVVDGIMYASAPWGIVHALDAASGVRRWVFDPKVDTAVTRKVCCGIVSRGLAVAGGRVFAASLDGRLFGLDAKTGAKLWEADTIVDHARGYTVTGAPYVAGGVVVIGNSGAELDARGYVSAYDLRTGALRWRFYTVPASPTGPFEHPELARAAKTWDPHSRWEVGLGGTVWDGMAYDPQLDLLYVGVGNSALYPRSLRSPAGGDNLFVASILALRPRTGRLAWYYQEVPGDQWDYTATQKIVLADLTIAGRRRKVLMQAPKDGFFYVLDRATGELISARPYVPVTWASHVDAKTGRPVETGQGDYAPAPKLVFPSPAGGHNWQPMSFSPATGLVYIPALEAGAVYWIPPAPFVYQKGAINVGALYGFPAANAGNWGLETEWARALPPLADLARGQPDTTMRGYLRAWDPVAQKTAWQVETSGAWVGQMNAIWNGGGVATTAGGLVLQGRSTGILHAYDARDGHELAQIDLGTSIMAAPMTYEVRGEQYVAVMAGYGGALGGTTPVGTAAWRYGNAGRIVALKLGGGPVPRPPEVVHATGPMPRPAVARFGTSDQLARGAELLKRHCARCHQDQLGGSIPDLRRMSAETMNEFGTIVLKGSRAAKGMGAFEGLVTPDELDAIRAAIVDDAWAAYESAQGARPHTPDAGQGASP
jgi:quinohemoprotein ethanol dehydrogenase